MKTIYLQLLLIIFALNIAKAQISTFDTDDEGFRVTGDVQGGTQKPTWYPKLGNPGGYAQAIDDAVGGVWYWVLPAKYLGNKCSAYHNRLSFDLITNDLTAQYDNVDIYLDGGGISLVYDTPNNPGVNWTSYSIKLDETAKWKYKTLIGAQVTKADMKKVMNNITRIWIRGEFRTGKDIGGIDNVIMETFQNIDLDGNDSSLSVGKGFNTKPICYIDGSVNICDKDLLLNSLARIDSITISNVTPIIKGVIEVKNKNTKINIENNKTPKVTLVNSFGSADSTDFKDLIKSTIFTLTNSNKQDFALLSFVVWIKDCPSNPVACSIPIYQLGSIGKPRDTVICDYSKPFSLFQMLKGNTFTLGLWKPTTIGKNDLFQPKLDAEGSYTYLVEGIKNCPADSAVVNIGIYKKPQLNLVKDTFFCNEKPFTISAFDPKATAYIWSDGSTNPSLNINEAGKYFVKISFGACQYSDTINLKSYTCTICNAFIPNAFSPNNDGVNDQFQIYLTYKPSFFHLQLYDRTGEKIFESNDPEARWDGTFRNKPMNPETFVYVLDFEYEYLGNTESKTLKGDVMLLR